MLGRLAASLAKELLNGQHVVVVRCEEINVSGSLYRNKLKYFYFLNKRHCTNPTRGGPFHHRAPSRILYRAIRGMIPHKTKRGAAALDRLRVYEGVPAPYDKKKRQVVPDAMRHIRLRPHRKYCRLGDLSAHVGWKHDELIKKLEKKRLIKAHAYHVRQKELRRMKNKAADNAGEELTKITDKLAEYGF